MTGFDAYNKVATMSTSKEKLLFMLFDGAVRFVRIARKNMLENRVAAKGMHVSKAIAILSELECSLDRNVSPELAGNLSSLYQYMISTLVRANLANDPGALDQVEKLLLILKEGFEYAAQPPKAVTMGVQPGVGVGPEERVSVAL